MKAMKTVPLEDAGETLREVSLGISGGPVIVTVEGRPVAAVVPIKEMDLEAVAVSTDPDFVDLIERSRRRMRDEETISSEEMRRSFAVDG